MTDAIVLAGGGREPGLDAGAANKGFLEIAGRPLLARVLDALRGASGVGRIAVVGPPEAIAAVSTEVVVVPDGGSIMDNVVRAVEALGAREPVLVVASDIPLLTAAAVEAFLAGCRAAPADFCYAIVPQEAMARAFPAARKTFVRVTDGVFTGGSVMLVNPAVIDRVRDFVERVIAARKKPWMLAQLFGWSIMMKFASGRLSIAEMEARVHELLGIVARAVVVPDPVLALDVDMGKPENLALIRAALGG
ncbi:MAG: NTP transferase domain-containing protein [Armatimonadota bacterium]|nr:NTP transferase domain-containing protein [Armatimonadota bacterium]MDR7451200.1 NTP transferase domain-containing protein [Armatimonadota bacterium]MDR7467195.1 NTP transferase domain-containing protein [Armatimonadota bacterium]MDR7495208.1 NTP transferase domain-containing protein [Armatimonadota bacterium]MDR7500081.1 NTP transferase domain-containing protein [Armatimonadota bacterium]